MKNKTGDLPSDLKVLNFHSNSFCLCCANIWRSLICEVMPSDVQYVPQRLSMAHIIVAPPPPCFKFPVFLTTKFHPHHTTAITSTNEPHLQKPINSPSPSI